MSDGQIIVRDTGNQKQDINDLSRDTANTHEKLETIFDKDTEQKRIDRNQLIGEVGQQIADIAATQAEIAATRKVNKDWETPSEAERDTAKQELAKAGQATDDVATIDGYIKTLAIQAEINQSQWGVGGDNRRIVEAGTALIQGLANGDVSRAVANASAPYLANEIAKAIPESNKSGRLAAHAIANVALALVKGENALSQAAGAVTAEAIGMLSGEIYGKDVSQLTEDEKTTLSAFASLAAGLAGGLAGGSTQDALNAGQAGKTTVENNALGPNSFGKGMADMGLSQQSLAASMIQNGATADELTEALIKNSQGQIPEGQDAVKGLLTAWGEFFGVPVSALTANGEMTPQQAAEILASGVPTSEAKLIQYVAAKAFLSVAKSSDLGLSPANQKYVDILSPEAKQHILYGDNPTQGGHLYPGNPGKTVFPQSWSADKVVHTVGDIATSPNTKWFAQTGTGGTYTNAGRPARWVAWEEREGVRVRVVYEPASGKIVTAFPDNNPTPPSLKLIKK